MYSQDFERCIQFILRVEGGYTFNPNDPGGETKYGITKRDYPDLNIASLTEEDAKKIYWFDYWLKNRCDKIDSLPVKLTYFDTCVNMGPRRAGKFLQKTISYLHNITIDGIVGPKTISICNDLCSDHTNEMFIYTDVILRRAFFYTKLATKRRKLQVFLKGWLNRLLLLRKEISNL